MNDIIQDKVHELGLIKKNIVEFVNNEDTCYDALIDYAKDYKHVMEQIDKLRRIADSGDERKATVVKLLASNGHFLYPDRLDDIISGRITIVPVKGDVTRLRTHDLFTPYGVTYNGVKYWLIVDGGLDDELL